MDSKPSNLELSARIVLPSLTLIAYVLVNLYGRSPRVSWILITFGLFFSFLSYYSPLRERFSNWKLSVPKNLAFLIPEILARPAIAGRARTLPVPPVGRPVGRREEDVRNAKETRSRDSVEGRSLQGRSGPSGGSVPAFGQPHCGRSPSRSCR